MQSKDPMRILVTNDDGHLSPGLEVLREIALGLSRDVWTVAPETNQSGASHSLTLHEPLRCREIGERTFAVRGTPTDCVIMGVRHILLHEPPALVLSGVNWGSNLAEDVTYSGTIAGAIEGTLLGIRSVAMSLTCGFDPEGRIHWDTPRHHGPKVLAKLIETGWPENVLININFPDLPPSKVAGIRVVAQGRRDQALMHIDERTDPWGTSYFWFSAERRRSKLAPGTDLWAIAKGFIAVTPLYLNFTYQPSCTALASAFAQEGTASAEAES